MMAWDSCALINLLKRPNGQQAAFSAMAAGSMAFPSVVLAEFASGEKPRPEETAIMDALLDDDSMVLLTTARESLEAGRWTHGLPRSGSKLHKRLEHIRHILDSTIASTAWHRGLAVVTDNTDDFDLFKKKHPDARILSLDEALAILTP